MNLDIMSISIYNISIISMLQLVIECTLLLYMQFGISELDMKIWSTYEILYMYVTPQY